MTDRNFINDDVFHEMQYKHSWFKNECIEWWGNNTLEVRITAEAYTGEGITDKQRKSYIEYQKNIEIIIVSSKEKIAKYISDIYEFDYVWNEIVKKITPTEIVFQQDGSWGIIFETEFDPENAITLYKDWEDKDFKIGDQDSFL